MLCLLMYCMIREQLQRDLACSHNVAEISKATDYYTTKTVTCFLYLTSARQNMWFILLMAAFLT